MPNALGLRREEVYRLLRNDILSCTLSPGQDLHEIDLAERFGLSKSPIRDALIRLAGDRLVTVTPRKGYRVAPVSLTDADELFQFRSMVEEAAVRFAASSCSPQQLRQLDVFRDLRAWGGKIGFVSYNRAFHIALANLCSNRRIAAAAQDLIEQFDRLVIISVTKIDNRDIGGLVEEHGAIIDAMQGGQGRRAARILGEHISRARKRVIKSLSQAAVVP
jgi:GntR family transcriptional regulator, rspAB operon transcriptional repressor